MDRGIFSNRRKRVEGMRDRLWRHGRERPGQGMQEEKKVCDDFGGDNGKRT